ncbi:MAG: hypothetical protein HY459_05015 [Parcubacteria group bacterium]|nr:hypothetical protein [Parcubacteria group bacterium]
MTIELSVREAYTRDVGRGVVRIDYDTMDKLEVSTGSLVKVEGSRGHLCKALPLYPSDEDRGIVRMDGLIRGNSGVQIDGKVVLSKGPDQAAASSITLTPSQAGPPVDERYLADALEGVAVTVGDTLRVE